MIVAPLVDDIRGASVLDLGAHDGRWAYAFAKAGAANVTAVEPRMELFKAFSRYPDDNIRAIVEFTCEAAIDYLEGATRRKQVFDVVAILGFLYHTMEHCRLFELIKKLKPRLIIVDSEFVVAKNSIIQITAERTDNPLNAVGYTLGEEKVLVGTPSTGAVERMAEAIGYKTIWPDFDHQLGVAGAGMKDYLRDGRKRRKTCYLVRQ